MSEKRVVGRNVVIGMGIICIILAVGLVGAIADYTLIISGKDSTIATKDWQIVSLNSQVTNLTNQLNDLNSTVNDLNSTVNDLTSIVNLEKYTYWVYDQLISQQPANSYTEWINRASYAGYVEVFVMWSDTNNTYVRVIYSWQGNDYDNQISVGAGNKHVYFPVLPAFIEIRVGNTNLSNAATMQVQIIYHY